MYLKRLEMQGFKSFVDKTVLEFSKGITAIVGPNGSGKSNISDAVKWVLGEQSPKTLRGSKMEDLIFAGTQNRKPVGMCEVSLIMDNEDHALNIDFLEVRVTRRLYRSGESEYLINGAICRLKDIVMLFADTGIGRDGYSIIGQGRIDEILSTKSEERRSIFEDASGIMKYRIRKNEAERKLASTEQNLLRINDIVNELGSQIKPLEKQSEVARKYLGLKYELRDIEVGVLSENITKAEEQLEEIRKNQEIIDADREKAGAALESLKGENESKLELSRQLDSLISQLKSEQFEHEKRVERLNGEIALNNEKIVRAEAGSERADTDRAEQQGKIDAYKTDIVRLKKNIEELDEKLKEIALRGGEKADSLNAEDAKLEAAEAKLEDIRAEVVRLQLKLGEKQHLADSAESRSAMVAARKAEIDRELEAIRESDSAGEGELEESEKEYQEAADAASDAKQDYQNKAAELADLRKSIDEDNKAVTELTGSMHSLSAQCKLLKEMEEGYEGYARSVKEVLQMCRKNPAFGSGIYGAVAQLITVSKEYELAIETALGQSYQNIITESEAETKAAIEFLKEHRYGRATFMPLTAANGRRLEDQLQRELRMIPGYLGIASDNVECEPRFRVIADSLLGRVAVFRNLDAAISAAKAYRYSFMCVTLEGDILRTSGAITGGANEKGAKTTGALSRTREIPRLEKQLSSAAAKVEATMKQLAESRDAAAAAEKAQGELFERMRELEAQANKLSAKVVALRERQEGRRSRRGKLIEELKEQINQALALNAEAARNRDEAAETEKDIAEAEKRLRDASEAAETVRGERENVRSELFAVKLEENTAQGEKTKAEENAKELEREIELLTEKIATYATQKRENAESITQLREDNHRLETQKGVSQLDAEKAAEKLRGVEARKAATDEVLGGMLSRITEINEEISRIEQEAGRLEIRRVRTENEINSGKNRLWEEYELTLTDAVELAKGIVIENYKEAAARINELRGAIKALGPVNVNAVEEYENTVTRFNFMSAQSKDMNETKVKLQKVIAELNTVMCERFSEQFEIIRTNFNQVFGELFGGGKADIVLANSDGASVLDCGIDIIAQPPGKKLQNMLLLSGGERALTAIALLFAILRMRPSPFCLLDEIEAALDDANVYRLSDYLSVVSDNTQFIMVTHRKGTMEYAGSLYGVTMEEKGISRVVSLKM